MLDFLAGIVPSPRMPSFSAVPLIFRALRARGWS